MSVTASELYFRAGRIIGSRTGTIGTVTVGASTTTIVLNGLKGLRGDNTLYAGAVLYLPDSADGSREALIQTWVDATGVATIANQTAAPVAGNRYMVWAREDYTLYEYRSALEKALLETNRSYRLVIPFTPLLNRYPLSQITNLTGAGDIDQVYATLSPLMLHNEDFSLWQNGASAAPDGYTLTGTGASISRVGIGTRSNYAAEIFAGANAARLTQSIPQSLTQWITRRSFPVFIQMRAASWLSTMDANSVRIFIYDGSTYHYSDYITANGAPQYPTISVTPTATMRDFTWGVEAAIGTSATVSWAGLMQNTAGFDIAYGIKDSGSQSFPYVEFDLNKRIRNVGGVPMIETPPPLPTTWGQLVVYLRRAFPAYSTDDDSFDDQYARVLTAGILVFLLEANKANQDRARIDAIRAKEQRIWKRMASNIQDLPVPTPPTRIDVIGA